MSKVKSDKLKVSVEIIMKTLIDDVLLKTYSYHSGRVASITKNFYELNLSDIVFGKCLWSLYSVQYKMLHLNMLAILFFFKYFFPESLIGQPQYEDSFREIEKEVKAYILQAERRYNQKNKK